jgi:hypothetical protein
MTDEELMNKPSHYILKGREPVPCESLTEWAKLFKDDSRRVALTKIGKNEISTVFLGSDHNWTGTKPILFETMIFGGRYDGEQERYHTYTEAEQGHAQWVTKVKRQGFVWRIKEVFKAFQRTFKRPL